MEASEVREPWPDNGGVRGGLTDGGKSYDGFGGGVPPASHLRLRRDVFVVKYKAKTDCFGIGIGNGSLDGILTLFVWFGEHSSYIENSVFRVQLTTSRIGNHTRLMANLLKVMTTHTHTHTLKVTSRLSLGARQFIF